VGLGAARVERFAHRQVLAPLEQVIADGRLTAILAELVEQATARLGSDGALAGGVEARRCIARCRFHGQESTLDLEVGDLQAGNLEASGSSPADRARGSVGLAERFEEQYEAVFGDRPAGREIELESLRVVVSPRLAPPLDSPQRPDERDARHSPGRWLSRVWFAGERRDTPVVERNSIAPTGVAGPALITERHSVTVLEPGWSATAHAESGCLILER
jgi:N-methylhydantoinase A